MMNGTAQEIADAIKVGRICGFLVEPGSEREQTHRAVLDMMVGRFYRQAKSEGLCRDQVEMMLSEVDDAVAEARRKIQDPN